MMPNILSIVTFLPLIGALVMLLIPDREGNRRLFSWGAVAISVITFLLSLLLLVGFDSATGQMRHQIYIDWIPSLNASYLMGVDGISLWLVLLNTFLFPLAFLSSVGVIKDRERMYYALLLFLETAVTGVFLAQDLLLFFFFWEAVLIPMYFLIGIWGGKNRFYATTKFVLYTMVGSLLMLAAIIALYVRSGEAIGGPNSFDLAVLSNIAVPPQFQFWAFLAFFLAFAIKVPLFPFHTWLPDAHTEAPTAGSIILAGVLLKMGTYGFIRFAIPLFPDAPFYPLSLGDFSFTLRELIMALSVVGIIYGAMVAAVQTDVKRLVAYSSIAHLGFVMLGLFSFNQQAVDGAILQMVAHGISTGGLFMLVGFIYERRHTRAISDFGGLALPMPVYYNIFLIIMLSSVGLPALNGFVGEFLILLGSFQANWLLTVLATTGVILAAVYLLYMFRRVFYGDITHEENRTLPDLTRLELAAVLPLVLMAFFMGIFPTVFLGRITPDSMPIVERMRRAEADSAERLISSAPGGAELVAEGGSH
jgi:NADH-quinone oxidoreductase subunit M